MQCVLPPEHKNKVNAEHVEVLRSTAFRFGQSVRLLANIHTRAREAAGL